MNTETKGRGANKMNLSTIYNQTITASHYQLPKKQFNELIADLITQHVSGYYDFIQAKPLTDDSIRKMNYYYLNTSLKNHETIHSSVNSLQNPLKGIKFTKNRSQLAQIHTVLQKECLELTDIAYSEEVNLYNSLKNKKEQTVKNLLYQIYTHQFGLSATLMKHAHFTAIKLAISYLLDNCTEDTSNYSYGTQLVLKWLVLHLNYKSQQSFAINPTKAKEDLLTEEKQLYSHLLAFTLQEGNLTKQTTMVFPHHLEMPKIQPFTKEHNL